MHFTSAAATLLLGAICAVAAPCSKARTFYNGTCTAETVTIRKEWRNLAESAIRLVRLLYAFDVAVGVLPCVVDAYPRGKGKLRSRVS